MGLRCGSTPTAVRRQSHPMSDGINDALQRPLASLRLSVTDRCNLRCRYCMPEDEYVWLPRTSILTFEEIERLTDVFAGLGVHKVRLTGGEPLLRHDLPTLGAMIARKPRIRDLALDAEGRFIEYMDVGGAPRWSEDQVVSQREMLEVLARRYGAIEPMAADGRAPAERFRLADGTTFGIIASVTAPFCRTCDRSRVTADGTWFLCLYAARGIDLREPLRRGAPDDELTSLIRETWQGRTDRGAEERLGGADPGGPDRVEEVRADPHREMHTRGG